MSRYVHLNPVRARCVDRPKQYCWSSYPGYHDPRRTCAWTTYEKVLGEFWQDPKKARAAYRQFVATGVQEKPVLPFSQAFRGVVVGSLMANEALTLTRIPALWHAWSGAQQFDRVPPLRNRDFYCRCRAARFFISSNCCVRCCKCIYILSG